MWIWKNGYRKDPSAPATRIGIIPVMTVRGPAESGLDGAKRDREALFYSPFFVLFSKRTIRLAVGQTTGEGSCLVRSLLVDWIRHCGDTIARDLHPHRFNISAAVPRGPRPGRAVTYSRREGAVGHREREVKIKPIKLELLEDDRASVVTLVAHTTRRRARPGIR